VVLRSTPCTPISSKPVSGQCDERMPLGALCLGRAGYAAASPEKSRKLLDQKGAGLGPLFMPDCDRNRHADPIHNIYGFASRLPSRLVTTRTRPSYAVRERNRC
jgi:hypothetical protein